MHWIFFLDLEAPPLNPITTVSPAFGCPGGWKAFDQYCYYVNLGTANYADSRTLCTMQSADLASIRDLNENNFIMAYVHEGNLSVLCLVSFTSWTLSNHVMTVHPLVPVVLKTTKFDID